MSYQRADTAMLHDMLVCFRYNSNVELYRSSKINLIAALPFHQVKMPPLNSYRGSIAPNGLDAS